MSPRRVASARKASITAEMLMPRWQANRALANTQSDQSVFEVRISSSSNMIICIMLPTGISISSEQVTSQSRQAWQRETSCPVAFLTMRFRLGIPSYAAVSSGSGATKPLGSKSPSVMMRGTIDSHMTGIRCNPLTPSSFLIFSISSSAI